MTAVPTGHPPAPDLPANLSEAAALWDVEPGYLNTSSYGVPPRPGWDALQQAQNDWRAGRTSWEPWADSVETSRNLFAGLVGADPATVATGAAVSQLLAPAANAVPDGSVVLVPDVEFTSNVFPWGVHADRGVTLRSAPARRLAEAITADVDVVAYSAVQSATGEVADSAAIGRAAREAGASSSSTRRRQSVGCRSTPTAPTCWSAAPTNGCAVRAARRSWRITATSPIVIPPSPNG